VDAFRALSSVSFNVYRGFGEGHLKTSIRNFS